MSVCICENENIENGLEVLFLDLESSLPFSFVHLPMVSVHSGHCFCTFDVIFVQKPHDFSQLVAVFVQLLLCTIGSVCCTFGLYFCTIGFFNCTFGYDLCTNGDVKC